MIILQKENSIPLSNECIHYHFVGFDPSRSLISVLLDMIYQSMNKVRGQFKNNLITNKTNVNNTNM